MRSGNLIIFDKSFLLITNQSPSQIFIISDQHSSDNPCAKTSSLLLAHRNSYNDFPVSVFVNLIRPNTELAGVPGNHPDQYH